ncbi:MAG: hypothetical protein ACRDD2_08760 [Sarcina sp.]
MDNKSNGNVRQASSKGIKIVIIVGILIILAFVIPAIWGNATTATSAQTAVQNEAANVYNSAEANVKTGTLVANGQVITTEQFQELPVTVAVNALFMSGQMDNNSEATLLTGDGLDPTMAQLQDIINAKAYKLKVNSQGQLTELPGN